MYDVCIIQLFIYLAIPIFFKLWLQVLVCGAEELDEVFRPTDTLVAAQERVTIFLQKLQAHQ